MKQWLNHVLKTGEWWYETWWNEKRYEGLNGPDVDAAFEALKSIFNAQWFLRETRARKPGAPLGESAHQIYGVLITQGCLPLEVLSKLGKDIGEVQNRKLMGDLQRRLRNKDQFLGAAFELEVLAHLVRAGLGITRNPPSGIGERRGDFKIAKDSQYVYVEVKNLAMSRRNYMLMSVSGRIGYELMSDPTVRMANVELVMKLAPELNEQVSDTMVLANLDTIVHQIKTAVIKQIEDNVWGDHAIEGIAAYKLLKASADNKGKLAGSLEGLSFDHNHEVRKLLHNALDEARSQLPKDEPGIVIVNVPLQLNPDILRRALDRLWEDTSYKHIVAVMLVSSFFDPENAKLLQHQVTCIKNGIAQVSQNSTWAMEAILSMG